MPMKIKNWKLALLAVCFITFLTSLGFWQLARAKQKTLLLRSFAERIQHPPLTSSDLNQQKERDLRFYRASLSGHFDNQHTLLLDNKIYQRQVGYEVFTPFMADGLSTPILIDRGFIPMGDSRDHLPVIQAITGQVTLVGLLNLPPAYVALGQATELSSTHWPLRVEFINLTTLSPFLAFQPFHYLLSLDPKNPAAYALEWKIVSVGPERHLGYAVQWFALALTLLIISIVLNHRQT